MSSKITDFCYGHPAGGDMWQRIKERNQFGRRVLHQLLRHRLPPIQPRQRQL